MSFKFVPRFSSTRKPQAPRRDRRARQSIRLRPSLTFLEERQLLSTIVVDNPTDAPVVGFTDLREAIALAALDADDDVITFDPNVFASPTTISLDSGAIDLTKATGTLTIQGPGAGLLSVSGNNASAVFGLTGGIVAISGLTITGGANDFGAVINYGGTATLADCVLSGNNDEGGAVLNSGGTTTLIDSTISNNTARSAAA
ncbi:MAG: right-handed parallel beta-helix repeat-containing protein [Isosphaeraceae bacterium]